MNTYCKLIADSRSDCHLSMIGAWLKAKL